ncbi:hypothetical protein EVA_17819 [gut metagenome]|uniref:Uncharacterized protein n=1 Tax=gut metagenome TaxID=749906 RepID=J9FWY5_9ZZZZ
MDVNRFFLLKRIYVSGYIEVVVVFCDLFKCGQVAVFLNFLPFTVRIHNFSNVLLSELVLCLYLLKLLAGINKQNIVIFLAAFFENQDAGRNAGAVEYISWETDNSIHIVFLFNEEAADYSFGISTEKHTMGSHTCHRSPFVQVVDHVENESIVGRFAWSKPSGFAETVIVVELVGSTPFCRERRICHYSVKLRFTESIRFQRISVFDTEIAEFDTVQKHVHTSQVIGRWILLLTENLIGLTDVCRTEQQRATTTGRVIHITQTGMANGDNLS